MQLYLVRKPNSGFTLIEMIITSIVVGVLAAITVPNLFGLFTQSQVKADIADVESILKEAQRQAIRKGKGCTVTINSSTKAISSNPADCLSSNREIDNSLMMKTDQINSSFPISFSYKGNVQNSYTIVLYSNSSSTQKCVYVSDGLGIIKQGDYEGNVSSTITYNQCKLSD
jgi:prepilin-type N-terminal cleavage/methylation domain-containing protein